MKYRPNIGKDIKRKHAQLLCLKQRWARKKGETETMNGVSNKLIFISYCQSVLRRPAASASRSPALPYTHWVRHWGVAVWTNCLCSCVLSRVQVFVTPWTVAHHALCSWDSPGKNTAIFFSKGSSWLNDQLSFLAYPSSEGVLFYYQCHLKKILMHAKVWESESRSVMSYSLLPHGLYSSWNSPGQNTGLDSLSLLQEIFRTQGSNPGLPHCRRILYQLSFENHWHRGLHVFQSTVPYFVPCIFIKCLETVFKPAL